ncbi:MAG: hypothetical protein E6J20_04525 [Chloroflexi bacterium]|nr:MAG: hypothetical protein E6J20_04525 [Chloroflexota bacterium]
MFKYLEVLFRHWIRFALLCLALPLVAGGAALLIFQGKDGSAQLWVDNPAYIGNVSTANGWNQYLTPAQNAVDSLDQLTQTDTFYSQLGQGLLDSHAVGSMSERDQVLSDVRTSLVISSSGSHLVTIKVECRRANVCIQVLTTTISLHRDWLIRTEQQQADVASQFYTAQLQQAKERLQTASDALNAYLVAHPIQQTIVRTPDPRLDRLESDVQLAQTSVNDLQDKLQSIQFSKDAAAEIDQTAVRTVDPPKTSGGRFTSVTKKYAIALAAAAALPGIAYLVFLGWIDRTTRNPKEIESRLGVRVVTTIGSLSADAA